MVVQHEPLGVAAQLGDLGVAASVSLFEEADGAVGSTQRGLQPRYVDPRNVGAFGRLEIANNASGLVGATGARGGDTPCGLDRGNERSALQPAPGGRVGVVWASEGE